MNADAGMWNRNEMESMTALGPNLTSPPIGGGGNGGGFAMMM